MIPAFTSTWTGARVLLLVGLGVCWVVVGAVLWPSDWIDPRGIGAAGVTLILLALPLRTSLDVLVVLAPFMFRWISPVGLLNLGTADLLLPVLLTALTVRTIAEQSAQRHDHRMIGGVVPLLVAAVTLLTGSLLVWSMADPDYLLSRAVSDTAKLAIGIVYFGLVISSVRRLGEAATHRALGLWAWVATGLSLASLAGAATGIPFVPDDGYGARSVGFFADPNLYASYLLLTLAVLLFRGTVAPSPVLVGQALVIVGGLITTGSRGGLATLALLAVFAAFMINSARLRLVILGFAVGAVAGAVFLVPEERARVPRIGVDRLLVSSADSGDDARFELWRLAIDLWWEHPFVGIGMGQYPRFSVGIVGETGATELGHVVHNSFLNMMVSLGLLGLVLFLSFLGWVLIRLYRADGWSLAQRHGLASGVLVLTAQMMTLNLENLRYVWIYLGVVVGLSALPGPDEQSAGGPRFGEVTAGSSARCG